MLLSPMLSFCAAAEGLHYLSLAWLRKPDQRHDAAADTGLGAGINKVQA